MLAEALEEIDNVTDHFPLARANSKWRAATWYAERRDQQRYGGHWANINVGNNSVSTEKALGEDASTLLAHLMKEESALSKPPNWPIPPVLVDHLRVASLYLFLVRFSIQVPSVSLALRSCILYIPPIPPDIRLLRDLLWVF